MPGVLAVIRGTAMNDDRQLRGLRQFHLLHEDGLLNFSGRVIVEVVEPDFSPGDYPGMPRPLQHLSIRGVVGKPGLVGMDSYACPSPRIFRLAVVFLG